MALEGSGGHRGGASYEPTAACRPHLMPEAQQHCVDEGTPVQAADRVDMTEALWRFDD